MKIDKVSADLIKLSLYLNNKVPGIVSELWIDEDEIKVLKSSYPKEKELPTFIENLRVEIDSVTGARRKQYLTEVLDSVVYQIDNIDDKNLSFSDFSEHVYGFRIERVSEKEISKIERHIKDLEKKIGLTKQEIFLKHKLKKEEYKPQFEKFVDSAKKKLPSYVTIFTDHGFEFEVVSDKPWSAFNSHIAPFRSRLTLNTDIAFTKLDLYRLAFHEAYGGHHSELSHKDNLLLDKARGEHGLVITFSPQTFVSEAIAEGIYVLLGGLDKTNNEQTLGWYYDRLIFALQNIASFWFFDDHISPMEIEQRLSKYGVSEETRKGIFNFSTDPLFGKYAPVYFSAFNFLESLYEETKDKDKLIKTLFTKPCTPKMLVKEFGKTNKY